MTPRNLVPATPMRFSGQTESTEPVASVSVLPGRVIKGPQKSGKDKSSITLPPGYVDRAAQRRSGLEASALNIFEEVERSKEPDNSDSVDPMKNKLEFLDEIKGIEGFPTCSQVQTERLMKLVFCVDEETITKTSDFKDNEAFLQFKSIEESKTQPFDPFNRPRRVFRASGTRVKTEALEDDLVLERVKEAVKRFETASERHQKYLETLNQKVQTTGGSDDIFPEVGVFDEKAALENVIKRSERILTSTGETGQAAKVKAKNRLFASKTTPKIEKEVDVFELIAQKSLDEEEKNKKSNEDSDGGGLFGFSNILPKLSRLENENNSSKSSETKLTGAYASILSDDETTTTPTAAGAAVKEEEDADNYLYPGYLENDPINFDSDEEIGEDANEKMPKNKRKLARKEDKEASKVEKLVKSKFGVDLSK